MCNYQEDEPPCIHHRSQFDTIPAPPPTFGEAAALAEMAKAFTPGMSTQERLQMCAESIRDVRSVSATIRKPSEPTMLSFRGGEVELPKPTRADLVLSAQQWARAIREHLVDWNAHTDAARGMCDRLDAILKELTNA